ncbi:MAG: glycosyltransferase family 39 protein [Anaerolineae bacterium]|nr:glycosyltransferase family 39 protein [Anaerolineae bacterium]
MNLSSFTRHGWLLLILLIFTLLALFNSIILPLGEAPDETVHFDVIQFIARAGHPPTTGTERAAAGLRGGFAPLYYTLMALPVAAIDTTPPPQLRRLDLKPERLIPADGLSNQQILHTRDESIPGQGVVLAWRVVRWLSIPLGWLTIILTYATSRLVIPRYRQVAIGAAIFVALLPRFAINSSVINEDNLAVPLAAATLLLLLKIINGNIRLHLFAALGAVLGLATLTKYYNLVLLPEVLLVLIFVAWQSRWPVKMMTCRWGLVALAFILVAGPWLGFIITRFGRIADQGWLVGLAAALGEPQITGGLRQLAGGVSSYASGAATFAPGEWFFGLLFRSFWVEFGWMTVFAPVPVYWLLGGLTLLALIGLLYALYLHRPVLLATTRLIPWLLLAIHLALFFGVVLLRYALGQTIDTGQGRHLFPALPAIAPFFVMGWVYFIRLVHRKIPDSRGITWLNLGLGSLFLAVGISFPFTSVLPVYYPYLSVTTASDNPQPPLATADGFALVDFQIASRSIAAGEALAVTLTWQIDEEVNQDYLVSLCLQDRENRPAACWRGHFADGRYPSRAWEASDWLVDTIYIPIPTCYRLTPQNYSLRLELWPLDLNSPVPKIENTPRLDYTFEPKVTIVPTDSRQSLPQTGELWQGEQRLTMPTQLKLNQTVACITYTASADPSPVFEHITDDQTWLPLAQLDTPLYLPCADGPTPYAHLSHFMVNPTLTGGVYPNPSNDTMPPLTLYLRDRLLTPLASTLTFNHTLAPLSLQLSGQSPIDLTQPTEELRSPAPHSPLISTSAHLLPVSLRWQSHRWMADPLVVSLKLLDKDFQVSGEYVAVLGDRYPNVLWVPTEIVEETYPLQIRPAAPPGLYRLELSLIHQDKNLSTGFTYLPLTQNGVEFGRNLYPATVRLLDPAHGTPPSHPFPAQLGDSIHLTGYDLIQLDTRTLQLALYWRNTDLLSTNYTVFTQFLGPDGQVWAQWDNPPQAGRYPTPAWAENDTVIDRYTLILREGAPAGPYRLLVGMYDSATSERLPVAVGGQPQPDRALELTTLALTP